MLKRLADEATVENVVVFVADSVRLDAVPSDVATAGTSAQAVAPSTFTASSVPSLLTGQYPVDHGVWGFGGRLDRPPAPVTAFDSVCCTAPLFGMEFSDPEEKPIFTILDLPSDAVVGTDPTERFPFEGPSADLTPPFFYYEHHHGGHIVYGDPERDGRVTRQSAGEYSRDIGRDTATLREQYERGVEAAGRRFLALRDSLESEGLLDQTLLMFTSDHGEGLGERGVFTHGAPMTPEVIRVPTVFCGAGLPDEAVGGVVSGIDIVPTLFSATDRSLPASSGGHDLWEGEPSADRVVESHHWIEFDRAGYRAVGGWNRAGGVVRHDNRARERLFAYALELLQRQTAPLLRRRPRAALALAATYLQETTRFGDDPPSPSHLTPADEFSRSGSSDRARPTERLEALGYLEQSE